VGVEEVQKPHPLAGLVELNIEATASGSKSSEGDGRTAADIEREIAEREERERESHGA
jgi:hypothetical protein